MNRVGPVVRAERIDQAGEANTIVIDEIGKVELTCPSFVEVVPRLLDGRIPVIATVALHGPGLIAQARAVA